MDMLKATGMLSVVYKLSYSSFHGFKQNSQLTKAPIWPYSSQIESALELQRS